MLDSKLGKKISIIIVNFRSDQYLRECIASLYSFENKEDLEIIVVNNGVGENVEKAKSFYPEIIVLNNENKGFGQAVNVGAGKAQEEILFFLNPDTEIIESIFSKIRSEFSLDKNLAVLSPRVVGENNENQEWIFGDRPTFWQLICNNLFGDIEKNVSQKKETDWVSGASMFVRKKDFLAVGGFDEKFFLYFEDIDLCLRLKRLGKKIVYLPEVKIKHFGSGSNIAEKERKKSYYLSQDYYFKKNLGFLQALLVRMFRKILK